jgi:hypothetical protein
VCDAPTRTVPPLSLPLSHSALTPPPTPACTLLPPPLPPPLLQLDNKGLLSALYEATLTSGEKVAGSMQLQVADLSQPVKYGFAIDLS